MVNLVYSHCCKVEPRLFRVGDDKQYFVYMCPKCFRTPVKYHEARVTEAGARKIWNKRSLKLWLT